MPFGTSPRALPRPLRFALAVARGFSDNGGLTLAAAVAHHMLLSAIPMLMVTLALFSRFVDTHRLARVLTEELSQLLPRAHAKTVVQSAIAFAQAPEVSGLFGLCTLLVFSTLAFRTLQRAIDIIFSHRGSKARRPLWSSALISLAYVLAIGAASSLQALALSGIDGALQRFGLHLPRATLWLSFLGMVLLVSSIYVVMPVGRIAWRLALWAGFSVALVWAALQRALIFYFDSLSPVDWVFGSMATIIAVLISFELLSSVVLLGAQAVALVDRAQATRRAGALR